MYKIGLEGWPREYELNKETYASILDNAMRSEVIFKPSVKLQNDIEKLTGRYATMVATATDALHFALAAYNIGPGDEVLVSNFSWISTASCISMVGATPVFCDIDLDSYHMSLDSIKRMYSNKVKALIYPQLFGNVTDIEDIVSFCKEHNIVLIEDSAQGLGASINGKMAGTFGDCGVYSFAHNKSIAGVNGGGVFLSNDREKNEKVRMLAKHGSRVFLGRNSKTYTLNSEVIRYRLQSWRQNQQRRQEIASQYNKAFEGIAVTQKSDSNLDHSFHKYTVRFEDKDTRDFIHNMLIDYGIESRPDYGKIISDHEMYKNIEHRADDCINSKKAASTILTIPCHPWMEKEDIHTVIDLITKLL